ncbi:MAG: glucose 1-dehydrogenase [Streptosporangiales bacterium]|nr:glucose 1-dehydrogenase [Streptosporangiales bacterium]
MPGVGTPGEKPFAGRTGIVTGGAGGIGSAIARALAAHGARLVLVDSDDAVESVAAECGAIALRGDIRDHGLPGRALSLVASGSSEPVAGPDLLVNAVGTQVRTAGVEVTEEDWQRLVDVNLSGLYRFCREAARPMIARGHGSMVNVSSLSADRALAGIVPYAATKAAVSQLTRGLAVELGPRGVRVNGVAPGYVATPMTADLLSDADNVARVLARVPLGRLAEPEDIAPAVVFLLSDAARYITGEVIAVDGGFAVT